MTATPGTVSAVSYLKREGGVWQIEGSCCADCGEIFLRPQANCAKCSGSRLEAKRLSERGTLYSYTIVHRSFPGIATPFIEAIVDLDGGGTIRGTLTGIAPDPAAITFGMTVELHVVETIQADADGAFYVVPQFMPAVSGDDR